MIGDNAQIGCWIQLKKVKNIKLHKMIKSIITWWNGLFTTLSKEYWKKEAMSGYLVKEKLAKENEEYHSKLWEISRAVRQDKNDERINGELYFVFKQWQFQGVATWVDNGGAFKSFQKISLGYFGEIQRSDLVEADEWFAVRLKEKPYKPGASETKTEMISRAEEDAIQMMRDYGIEQALVLSKSYLDECISLNGDTKYWQSVEAYVRINDPRGKHKCSIKATPLPQ